MFSGKVTKAVLGVASLLISGAVAHGAFQIIQFEPTPVSPNVPEFSWTGPAGNFQTGAGVVGNGDGDLAVPAQTAGGLQIDTPLPVPGLPNSTVDASGTHFFDVTMHLSSDTLPADLAAVANSGIVAGGNAVQPLTSGSFSLYTTPALDSPAQIGAGPILLLSGTLTNNSLTVPLSSTSAGFQTATVNYTGGAILQALNGGSPIAGSASISLVSLDGNIGVLVGAPIFDGINMGSILPFDANATGVFDTPNIPEPASIGLIASAGLLGLRRRRA